MSIQEQKERGKHLPDIKQRIVNILQDNKFKNHCKRCREENPNFDEEFTIAERIAKIDIGRIRVDDRLIHIGNMFSEQEVDDEILSFYGKLDEMCPTDIFLQNVASSNFKYLSHHNSDPEKKARSYCSSSKDKNGVEHREIYTALEGRVGDISNACHEVAHSLSKAFIECRCLKNKEMSEVSPLIAGFLSNLFLQDKYPKLAENLNEDLIHTQVLNVIKAREVLLDGLVIKAMLGEISINEIERKYGDMFLKNTNILERCLDKIEANRFSNMYEKRYLLPQAISQILMERYKDNPNEVVRQFKTVLFNDADWTVEDTIVYLGFTNKKQIIDNYVDNFDSRMDFRIEQKTQF